MWIIFLTVLNSSQQSSKKENGNFQIGNSWLKAANAHHLSSPLSAPFKARNHLSSLFKWPLSAGGPREPTRWKKETSGEGPTCSKGLGRKLVELPALAMTHPSSWEEIKSGNWAAMRMSHEEGDSEHSEANSCRTMEAVRGYFCLASTINWTWWSRQRAAFPQSLLLKEERCFHAKSQYLFPVWGWLKCHCALSCVYLRRSLLQDKRIQIEKWQEPYCCWVSIAEVQTLMS